MARTGIEERIAEVLRQYQRFESCADKKRRELKVHVAMAEEVTAQRVAVEARSDSLRALAEEMLDEADAWRAESNEPWTQSLRGLLIDERRDADAAAMEATVSATTVLASPSLASPRAASAEASLEVDIQHLREENTLLAAKVHAMDSRCARAGGTVGYDEAIALDVARRRVVSSTRNVRVVEKANARIRTKLDELEAYQRRLEVALLAQSRRLAQMRRPTDDQGLRALNISGAARHERLNADSRASATETAGALRGAIGADLGHCGDASSACSCANRSQRTETWQVVGSVTESALDADGMLYSSESCDEMFDAADDEFFDLNAIEAFVSDMEASLSRSPLSG